MPHPAFRRVVGPDPNNGIKGDKVRPSLFNDIYEALENTPTLDDLQSPVNLQGVLTSTGDLPDDGNTLGDAYLVNGTIWVWSGTAWTNQGSLTTGPQGEPALLNLKGTVALEANLPASGNVVNDVYVVEADGHGWAWTSGHEWVDIGAFQGPQGPGGADTDLRGDIRDGGYGVFYADAFATVQDALDAAETAGGGVVVGNLANAYAQTTTLTIPAGVTLRTTPLSFTGAPDATNNAVSLNGAGAIIEDCPVSITAGDYRRGIGHRASNTRSSRNTISMTTADVTAGQGCFIIFASMVTAMTNIVIEDNDLSADGLTKADGVQASNCPGIIVRSNHIHDFTNFTEPTKFEWGVYVSTDSPGATVESNLIHDLPGGGIHINIGAAVDTPDDYGRRVIGNTIRDVDWVGIGVDYANGPEIAGNTILRCDLHINDIESASASIHDNVLADVEGQASPVSANRPIINSSGTDSRIHNNTIGARGDALHGIYLSGVRPSLHGNKFLYGRPRNAIRMLSTAVNGEVVGGSIYESDDATKDHAIRAAGVNQLVRGVTIRNPSVSGWIGVSVSASAVQVVGCDIYGGTNCVWITAGTAPRVTDNVFAGSTSSAVSNSGTNSVIKRNAGWITENSGVTSVADGGNIAHGLAATPTKYGATPSTSGEFVSITSVGGTNIVVAIKKHDNTAGTTQNIAWWAEV